MKIQAKISITIFILIIITGIIAITTSVFISKKMVVKEVYINLENKVSSQAYLIERFLEEYRDIVKILASEPLFVKTMNSLDNLELKNSLEKRVIQIVNIDKHISQIHVLDKYGNVLTSSHLHKGINTVAIANQEIFERGKKDFYIRDIHTSLITGTKVISFSAPIIENGDFLGIVIANIEAESELYKIIANELFGQTGEIYLINKEGYMISPSRFLKNTFLTLKVNSLGTKQCLWDIEQGKTDIHKVESYENYRNKNVIGMHKIIASTHWCLLAEIDKAESLQSVYEVKSLILPLLATILIVSVFITFITTKTITKPILKLHQSVKEVQDGNWNYKITVNSQDEIGKLSQAFDNLLGHLKNYSNEITTKNKELERSEFYVSMIIEKMIDGLITIDEWGIIKIFNPAAEKIFGYSANEVIGHNVSMLMPEPYRSQHNNYLERYRKTRTSLIMGSNVEVQGQHKNGKIFELDFALDVMRIAENREFVAIVRDISERKKIEFALKKAKKEADDANYAKSAFLAKMSHEIRTPMNAIIGFSDLLLTLITDKKQKSYLDTIRSSSKTLLVLINGILDLSKIEAGRLEIQYNTFNVHIFLREIEQFFSIKTDGKGLDFFLDIEKDLPEDIVLDEIRLKQVLINLISNAIKFTDEGYIKLSARKQFQEGGGKIDLILAVEDTGIGIPKNQQAKIFESFTQVKGQSIKKYEGTGLGLTISKQLAKLMNGEITVKSTMGKGSTFEIVLKEVELSIISSELITIKQDFNLKNIIFEKSIVLVVDDIESNRELIKECLNKVNLNVIEAKNGRESLTLAKKYQPDLILMDLKMPVMNGYDAVHKLKENEETKHIPVLALTASATLEEKALIKNHPFDDYLYKPVEVSELLEKLSHYFTHTKIDSQEIEVTSLKEMRNYFDMESLKRLPELIKILKPMLAESQILADLMEIDGIISFGKNIAALGEEYHLKFLIDFGNSLAEHTENFELDIIDKMLREFNTIIMSIKS